MRVCLIDDDDIYQFLIKKELRNSPVVDAIQVFTDGEKALDFFREHLEDSASLPDVIFLDINMPIMNGWQFLEQFRPVHAQIDKTITIYLVSSSFDDRDIKKSEDYEEVADYIIKPVKRSELVSVLKGI